MRRGAQELWRNWSLVGPVHTGEWRDELNTEGRGHRGRGAEVMLKEVVLGPRALGSVQRLFVPKQICSRWPYLLKSVDLEKEDTYCERKKAAEINRKFLTAL